LPALSTPTCVRDWNIPSSRDTSRFDILPRRSRLRSLVQAVASATRRNVPPPPRTVASFSRPTDSPSDYLLLRKFYGWAQNGPHPFSPILILVLKSGYLLGILIILLMLVFSKETNPHSTPRQSASTHARSLSLFPSFIIRLTTILTNQL
jgi:hypothetical protein